MEQKAKRIVVAAVALSCVLTVAVLVVWQPWAGDAGEGEVTEKATEAGSGEGEASDAETEADFDSDGEEASDAVDREDYDSDEEYLEALARSFQDEVEVPEENAEEDGIEYRKGTLTVYFERAIGEDRAREIVEEIGGVWVNDTFGASTGMSFAMATIYLPDLAEEGLAALEVACDELEAYEGVRSAVVFTTNDFKTSEISYCEDQYYLETCRFADAWEVQTCDREVKIAIIDSGFQCSHEDLESVVVGCFDASTGVIEVSDSADDGHGTAVAGVACAVVGNAVGIDGASYNALIVPVRIMDDDGNRPWSYVLKALQYLCALVMIEDPPAVINMSFEALHLDEDVVDATQECISGLSDAGVVCVAAAGNWDPSDEEDSIDAEKYPACFTDVIGVASIDADEQVSWFSNRNSSVDLCAPGEDIYSTTNKYTEGALYGYLSGTSFAAPQVSAAAALLKAKYPSMTSDQIKSKLTSSARDLGDDGRDDEYGYGLLDAAAALGCDDVLSGGSFDPIPTSVVDTTDDFIRGAATRDAMPALEILGLASVEESGMYAPYSLSGYGWGFTSYAADSFYGESLSPFVAELEGEG